MGDDTTTPAAVDLPRFTVRIPEILKARIESYARKRKEEYPKYSINDFFLEAAREKLDQNRTWIPDVPGHDRKFSMGSPVPGDIINGGAVRTHAQVALEHAAKAEAPIGKSVTEFLLNNSPKIGGPDLSEYSVIVEVGEDGEPTETYQLKCIAEFGAKVMAQAAKSVPRWAKMSWEQRHEFLKAQQENAW